MKKAMYRTGSYGKETRLGFDPGYLWKSVSYFRGPKYPGRYLVIKKDGRIGTMYCTGSWCNSPTDLFKIAANVTFYNESYMDDVPMTDSDLMDLYRSPYSRWYEIQEWHEYDDYHEDLYVYTEKSEGYPLYFMDLNLDEKIELDEDGEIKGCEGTTWFSMDKNGEYVRTESKMEEEQK